MKTQKIYRGLIPLIFFSVFTCYSQQSFKSFIYQENKPIKLELIARKPLSNILSNGNSKSRNEKINETINSDFPLSDEIKYLFNFYYNLSDGYQEFKRLRNSFTSYEFLNDDKLAASLQLVNFRSLRNLNEYGVLFNLKIKFP